MIYVVAAVLIATLMGYLVWLEIRGQRIWVFSEHKYEGFPLLLRRLERPPFPSRRTELPDLVTITHMFTRCLADGLPEPEYNDSLCGMDEKLVDIMKGIGSAVLVETFGGERNYYYYVSDEGAAEARFRSVKQLFGGEDLTFDCRPDRRWNFLYRYCKNFFPELLWAFDPLPSKVDG
jgi:hypothetical protein